MEKIKISKNGSFLNRFVFDDGVFVFPFTVTHTHTHTHTHTLSQERDKCIWKEEPGRGSYRASNWSVTLLGTPACRAWTGHSAPKPSTAQQTFAQGRAGKTGPGTEQEGSAKLEWLDSLVDRPMGRGGGGPGSRKGRGLAQPPRPASTAQPQQGFQGGLGNSDLWKRTINRNGATGSAPRYLQDTCLGLRVPR